MVDAPNQCAHCQSPIVSGQRWVREKICDRALNGRDPSYRRYHAEPFAGHEGSCWEEHQMEVETRRAIVTLRNAYDGEDVR